MPDPHPAMAVLLTVTASRNGTVEVTQDVVTVRLGLAWSAQIPRRSITSAGVDPRKTISIGAHGWRGDWLVNTSNRGLVVLTVDPPATARCLGVPVSLRTLHVSLADPQAFLAELGAPTAA
jgi:hypothetical protein